MAASHILGNKLAIYIFTNLFIRATLRFICDNNFELGLLFYGLILTTKVEKSVYFNKINNFFFFSVFV